MREPIALEYDETTNQWTIVLDDGKGGSQSAVLPGNIVDGLAQRVTTQRAISAAIKTGIQVQVAKVAWENMGDCAAMVRKPLTYDPHESVLSLVTRAHDLASPYHRHHDGDRIELQVIQATIPEVSMVMGVGPLDF